MKLQDVTSECKVELINDESGEDMGTSITIFHNGVAVDTIGFDGWYGEVAPGYRVDPGDDGMFFRVMKEEA